MDKLRTTCIGCPCKETKDGKDFCYYYQSYIDVNVPCGNRFDKKPNKTQEQLEEECFGKRY